MAKDSARSVLLAGIATLALLAWVMFDFSFTLVNIGLLLVAVVSALGAIWLAWRPDRSDFHEADQIFDRSFTSS